ncbi:hypothetical protein LINGRAHAP2_LOCUS35704, partial [Linum grandiflorum]
FDWLKFDLPDPSLELGRVVSLKIETSWFVELRVMREAGFTEQRSPPSPSSGRITGHDQSSPHSLMGCPNWTNTFSTRQFLWPKTASPQA